MNILNKMSAGINTAAKWFLIAGFSIMTIAYFGQIVLRYVFGTGFHWTEELTRYTNVAVVMVGTAVISGRKSHINVSVLEAVVPPKMLKWIYLLQQVLTIAFFGAAIYFGLNMMKLAGTQVSTNMRIPMKYVYAMFPVAFSLLVFQVLVYILNEIFRLGKEEEV